MTRLTLTALLQGKPTPPVAQSTELKGPFDDDFEVADDLEVTDTVWSPCTTNADINLRLTVMLRNDERKNAGYVNVSKLPTVKLVTRECDPE